MNQMLASFDLISQNLNNLDNFARQKLQELSGINTLPKNENNLEKEIGKINLSKL